MSRLKIERSEEKGARVLALRGALASGAKAVLTAAVQDAPASCVIDWDGVHLASSDGIREWIEFAKGRQLRFRRCRPAVVLAFNMVPACVRGVAIESLYGTFVCPECEREHDALLTVGRDVAAGGGLLRPVACPHCGEAATDLNIDEADYFRVLKA